VFKCTVVLADIAQWETFNKVYVTYFKPGLLRARSAFGANGLALGPQVELECLAYAGKIVTISDSVDRFGPLADSQADGAHDRFVPRRTRCANVFASARSPAEIRKQGPQSCSRTTGFDTISRLITTAIGLSTICRVSWQMRSSSSFAKHTST